MDSKRLITLVLYVDCVRRVMDEHPLLTYATLVRRVGDCLFAFLRGRTCLDTRCCSL